MVCIWNVHFDQAFELLLVVHRPDFFAHGAFENEGDRVSAEVPVVITLPNTCIDHITKMPICSDICGSFEPLAAAAQRNMQRLDAEERAHATRCWCVG